MNFWTYRRIVDKKLFEPGSYKGDVSVVNYHQNDYALGSSHYGTPESCAKHIAASKQLSLSFLHWLQTESPRGDGKIGWPELRPCPEQSGTADGMAMAQYIRESRRIVPTYRVLQQHVLWISMYKYNPTPTESLYSSALAFSFPISAMRKSHETCCWSTRYVGTIRRLSRMYGAIAMPSAVPDCSGQGRSSGQPVFPSPRGLSV